MFPGGLGKCLEDHQCRQSVGVSSSLPAHHLSSSSGRNPWQSTSLPALSQFAANQKKKEGKQHKLKSKKLRLDRFRGNAQIRWNVADDLLFCHGFSNSSRSQTHTLLSWSRALSICSSWAIFCLVADAWLFPFGSCDSSGRKCPTETSGRDWTSRN